MGTVSNLLGTTLLVDEEFLQAVLVGADEILGVLDDVVEELERADRVQPAANRAAHRVDVDSALPRGKIAESRSRAANRNSSS